MTAPPVADARRDGVGKSGLDAELRAMEEISKEWCMNMAAIEGDAEIGAGVVAMDPVDAETCPNEGTRCHDCDAPAGQCWRSFET